MYYEEFLGEKISKLGFGAMRLPLLEDGSVDEEQAVAMMLRAAEAGVNYIDTAYPYHGGISELVVAKALAQLPKGSMMLANKYPGHQIADTYDPAEVFEDQLEKCDVDCFDFYLLHNVYENSLPVYMDPQWGIVDYFVEQKKAGRIKHLGFSTHGSLAVMRQFLEYCGEHMEFCQIQLNWLDWTLQSAKEKCDLLAEYGLPIIVMEPVRGGALANLPESAAPQFAQLWPNATPVEVGMRWLQRIPNVMTVLTGSSNMEQLEQNLAFYAQENPLSDEEHEALQRIAASMTDIVPCTACRYCVSGCPVNLDIPELLAMANDARFKPSFNVNMRVEALPEGNRPEDCVGCGTCVAICPQVIDIPGLLAEFVRVQAGLPSWEAMSRDRAEAARKLREARA